MATAAETPNSGDTNSNTVSNNATTDDLKIGTTGEKVSELQKWLKEGHFYTGEIDGNYSNHTEAAVKLFQKTAHITEDGWVGNETRETIEKWDQGLITAPSTETSSTSTSQATTSTETSGTSTSQATTDKSYKTSSKTTTSSRSYSTSGTKGTGDCWTNSEILYNQLTSSGTKARIVQYGTSLSSNHRSVQTYQNGAWVDYDYKGNGYGYIYRATSSKPGMTVIK